MSEYKVGDIVVCLPGFHGEDYSDERFAGAGYKENLVFVVTEVLDTRKLNLIRSSPLVKNHGYIILFGAVDNCGVFAECVRPPHRNELTQGISKKYGL